MENTEATKYEEAHNVECIIAESIEDKIGRLEVVTSRYKNEDYLKDIDRLALEDIPIDEILGENGAAIILANTTEEQYEKFLNDGLLLLHDGKELFIDKYLWSSVPFVTKENGRYTGSARLIFDKGLGLPALTEKIIDISERWKEIANNCKAEFSQFAILRGSNPTTSVKLLKMAYKYSKSLNIEEWVAVTDNSILRLLNSSFFQFDIPNIGPSTYYMGSNSTPIYINMERCLDNAAKYANSKSIADYIRN